MRRVLLILGLCLTQASAFAPSPAQRTVKVERDGQTLRFAPFGGQNFVVVQCPQRSMTGFLKTATVTWPGGGGLTFDYAASRLTVNNAAGTANWPDTPPAPSHLRLSCDGNTPKLEAGAGLRVKE